MTIQEQRRKAFEELYYDLNCMGVQSRNIIFRRKTMGDYYYKAPREAWFWFNAALDSVEVELPGPSCDAQEFYMRATEQAIESAGLRVKG